MLKQFLIKEMFCLQVILTNRDSVRDSALMKAIAVVFS